MCLSSINNVESLTKTAKLMLVLSSWHSYLMFLHAMHDDECCDEDIIIIERGIANHHALRAMMFHLLLTIWTWCHFMMFHFLLMIDAWCYCMMFHLLLTIDARCYCMIALEFFSLTLRNVNCRHHALGSKNCDAHCCYLVIFRFIQVQYDSFVIVFEDHTML